MRRPRRLRAPADASRQARERAILCLEAQDSPVSSALLAREALGLRQGSDAACAAILTSLLGTDPRVARTATGCWLLVDAPTDPSLPSGSALGARPWAVWAVEEGLRAAAVVRLEEGRITAERHEPDDDFERSAAGMDRAGDARLSTDALARLSRAAAGALWASWDPTSLAPFLDARDGPAEAPAATPDEEGAASGVDGSAWAPAAGEPPTVVSLPRLVRAVLPPPRPRTLERLAAGLGLVFVDPVSPLARARLMGECLLLLLERDPLRDLTDPKALDDLSETRRRGAPAGSGAHAADDAPDHRSLPTGPGVYRFFDREGRLLYVGKARDLRRRVGSYFGVRERPDPRTSAWVGSIDRIEHEPSGSELEAMLREADQIALRAPLRNRQRAVHARTGKPLGDLVLVQRAERAGAIRVALVSHGTLAARVVLGPRGGGAGRLRALVARLYFAQERDPSPRGAASKAPRAGGVRSGGKTRAIPPTGRAARAASSEALVRSWLRSQPPAVPPLDPTDDPGPDEACARILATATALRRGETGVFYR